MVFIAATTRATPETHGISKHFVKLKEVDTYTTQYVTDNKLDISAFIPLFLFSEKCLTSEISQKPGWPT